jgi:CMP-N-acetylneuraminic acid synthetase
MAFENITAVIPVREKQDITDTSLLSFGDVTLLEWKVIQLKHVLPPERIVLSTNSEKAADLVKPYGIRVVKRDKELCKDGLPFSKVTFGIIDKVQAEDIAICPSTAPMLGPKVYETAFSRYQQNLKSHKHLSLTTVNEMRDYIWDDKKPLNYSTKEEFPPAGKLPVWYRFTNGLFIMGKKRMFEKKYFIDENPDLFVVDKLAGTDLVYFDDYKLTRELLSYYLSRESGSG